MSGNLIYIIGFIVVAIVCIGATYCMKKFNITPKDTEGAKLLMNASVYFNKQLDYKNKDKVDIVLKYSSLALEIVNKYYDAKNEEEKRALLKSETIKLCKVNNVEFDEETLKIVDDVSLYLCGQLDKK